MAEIAKVRSDLQDLLVTLVRRLSTPLQCLHAQPLADADMSKVVDKWDADFVDIKQELLFELILAANYMDIKPLLDLTCAKVASMIKGRTPDEIRKIFNISSDFTPEEEIKVRADNPWLEEC